MRRSFCVSGDSRRLKRDLTGVKKLITRKVSKQNPIKWVSKVEMAFLFLSFIFYLNRQWETEKSCCNLISFRTVSYWPEIDPALSEREMIQIFFKNHCYLGVHCSALCIQLFRERLSEEDHATTPKGIVGGFEFTVLQRNLKELHDRPWT